jgi:hypothetical protein
MITDVRHWRLPADQFDAVLQLRVQTGPAAVPALLGIAARLEHAPLENLGSFAEVIASEPDAGPHHEPLGEAILAAVLQPVDAHLQRLYRDHLTATSAIAAPHWERVLSLDAVREHAFAVAQAHDWAWLARWFGRDGPDGEAWCLRRLSNLAFPCRYLNLRFTYHCNIQCRHCYNESGPDRRAQRLDVEQMLSLVREMPAAGIPGINLTGGEPFLYLNDVLAIVREARRVGVATVRVFTNGFWAQPAGGVARVLGQLRDAGFGASPTDLLKVSAGSFHQEFLPEDVIARIAEPYFALFGRPIEADIEIDPSGDDRLKPVSAWTSAPSTTATLVTRDVSRVGRGRDVAVDGGDGGRMPCHLIDQLAIEPDGACRPCCGLNAQNDGVRIGQVGRHSLRDLVKRMQNDPVLQMLAATPMREVFPLVGKPVPAAGRLCELCQAAIGAMTDREPLMATLEPRQRYYPFWFTDTPGTPS